MANNIEEVVGFKGQIPSAVAEANKTVSQRPEILRQVVGEFDQVISTINGLPSGKIDESLAPHLLKIRKRYEDNGLPPLPTLQDLRKSEDSEVRQGVETIFSQIRDSVDQGEWSWLKNIKKAGRVAGNLYIESYGGILRQLPEYQDLFADLEPKDIVLAFEEAMLLWHPEFQLNRYVSEWYSPEEGFTPDFIDYAHSLQLIQIALFIEPDILSRRNMLSVINFIRENPRAFLEQMKTLNQAIRDLNEMATSRETDPMLVNLKKASQLISQRPLPAPLDSLTDPNKRLSYLLALRRPLRRTNLEMKKGEELESPPPLPPGTIPDWLRIHVEAKTPEAILAALLVHTVELWSHQVGYADLPKDTLLNAICEVLGYRHNNSALFRLLYNPRYGIGWYDPAWGFSEEFTAHLQEKTGIKPD